MDITKMTVTELKVLAYDLIGQLQQVQNDLGIINREIADRNVIPQKPVELKEEPKPE